MTEFLPVSSSGHLVIAQHLLPFVNQPGVLFEVILHAATVLSIVFYFRRRLVGLIAKYWVMLMVGTIPAAVTGFTLRNSIDLIFGNIKLVGIALLFTALINFLVDAKTSKWLSKQKGAVLALLIGVFQAIAIIPGISRSASTILSGTKFGFKKKEAAEFSFLLSIPAIAGANILELVRIDSLDGLDTNLYVVGFISAFISGYIAISLVYKLLEERKFKLFGYYCMTLGILIIFFSSFVA